VKYCLKRAGKPRLQRKMRNTLHIQILLTTAREKTHEVAIGGNAIEVDDDEVYRIPSNSR
jgi:hypothetical protein